MGVGSKDSVPADFPKKNSGLAPEGLSIRTGTGAGHRPLWDTAMAGDRPQCPQYREPFRGEAGVLFWKVGGYGIF